MAVKKPRLNPQDSPAKAWGIVVQLQRDPEIQPSALEEILRRNCQEYVFQKEAGSVYEGLQYQVWAKFESKMRQSPVIDMFAVLTTSRDAISARKEKVSGALQKYCQKSTTRVAGPWCYPAHLVPEPVRDPLEGKTLRPFQEMVMFEDTYTCDLLFEAYGAPGCVFCNSLASIADGGLYNHSHSTFAQEAVLAYGRLPGVKSLLALHVCEGGLVDPTDDTRQARFHMTMGYECTVRFKGLWLLDEQLDVMKAMQQGFEARCSHSMRARMRIERQ